MFKIAKKMRHTWLYNPRVTPTWRSYGNVFFKRQSRKYKDTIILFKMRISITLHSSVMFCALQVRLYGIYGAHTR